ncbi:hypothetical protein EDD17DRAFT_1509268 [Pisolithus thermaeus]|nr:hypothetical protein EDD17DRAFT_1509268 [Pisolithus thermaeus]
MFALKGSSTFFIISGWGMPAINDSVEMRDSEPRVCLLTKYCDFTNTTIMSIRQRPQANPENFDHAYEGLVLGTPHRWICEGRASWLIYTEGEKENVDEFVRNMKAKNWLALGIRFIGRVVASAQPVTQHQR